MKLYDFGPAASALRVRIFLAEKDLEFPIEELNVREGKQYDEPFATMNPFNCVPMLELDDGTVISESVSICRYLEEMHPEPSLFGRTPVERATIDMWNRRFELDGLIPGLHAVRNHLPAFAGRVIPGTRSDLPQSAAIVERGKQMLIVFLGRVEAIDERGDFVAGNAVSIADITAYIVLNMANTLGLDPASNFPKLSRWHQAFAERPSTKI